jgi:threonine dehydratase
LVSVVSDTGANVLQVTHERSFAPADVAKVRVTLVLETSSHEHVQKVRAALASRGFDVASNYVV